MGSHFVVTRSLGPVFWRPITFCGDFRLDSAGVLFSVKKGLKCGWYSFQRRTGQSPEVNHMWNRTKKALNSLFPRTYKKMKRSQLTAYCVICTSMSTEYEGYRGRKAKESQDFNKCAAVVATAETLDARSEPGVLWPIHQWLYRLNKFRISACQGLLLTPSL